MMAGVGGYAPLSTGAQSGPTHDQQPPFSFSSSDLGLSHVGLPDVWAWRSSGPWASRATRSRSSGRCRFAPRTARWHGWLLSTDG